MGNNVAIFFENIDTPFLPFGPPAFDSASLDGSVSLPPGLAVNPSLEAFAFGSGKFGTIGPLAPAPLTGKFSGALGPVFDPAAVTSLAGTFAFTFGAGQAPGALVRLPTSAVVRTSTSIPEPSGVVLFGTALIGLLSYSWRCRKRLSKVGCGVKVGALSSP